MPQQWIWLSIFKKIKAMGAIVDLKHEFGDFTSTDLENI